MTAKEDPFGLPPVLWTDGVTEFVPSTRFWSMVDEDGNGCWLWRGTTDRGGYGSFHVAGEDFMAHRVAWFLTFGTWPVQTLDHLCCVRACVNSSHLEDVPQRVNTLRSDSPTARNARKTHCPAGHAFTAENTYIVNQGISRKCRACALVRGRAFRAKKRAESFTHL